MNEKLRAHVEELFKDAPQTKQMIEVREEILQNTIDRYNDLIAEGKSEEAAYNISVAGIGDVEHLIDSIMAPKSMSGYSREEIEKNNRHRSILLSVAVALYICCVIPPIFFEEVIGDYEGVGAILMFVIAALATAIIIYRNGIKLHIDKTEDTVVENFKEWNQKNKEDKSLQKAVSGAIWCLILVIYFVLSFSTGAWYITWLVFCIGGAVDNVVKAIFDLAK